MILHRRNFLFFLPAAVSAPTILFGALKKDTEGNREFKVIWRGMNVGYSRIKVSADGFTFKAEIDVNLSVRILGVTFYSYSLKNSEFWEQGQLIKLESESQENDKKKKLKIFREKNILKIEGRKFTGKVSEEVATTSYFTSDFLSRKVWINTDSGELINVNFKRMETQNISTFNGVRQADKWVNNGELNLTLFYDQTGDWIGSNFPVGNDIAAMVLIQENNSIHTLWQKAQL